MNYRDRKEERKKRKKESNKKATPQLAEDSYDFNIWIKR